MGVVLGHDDRDGNALCDCFLACMVFKDMF